MTKKEFLCELKKGLTGLPKKDVEERLAFYGEMIDDRMEEGASESEAVAGIGDVDKVVSQIVNDIPLMRIIKEKISPKRNLKGYEIALIIMGFPLWFPLSIALCAVLFSLYIVFFALIGSLWAIDVSFSVTALGFTGLSLIRFAQGAPLPGAAMLGIGLFLAGIAILAYFGFAAASKGMICFTKKSFAGFKKSFIKKEAKQ